MSSQVGAGLQAIGSIYSGIMQGKVADTEAKQLNLNAKAARASGTAGADIQNKRTQLVQSAARAAAGGSGGGVTDATVQDVQAETGRTGEYAALSALYQGDTEARNLNLQAGLTTFAGQQAEIAAGYNAVEDIAGAPATQGSGSSTLGEQGVSMFDKYAGQIPEWMGM